MPRRCSIVPPSLREKHVSLLKRLLGKRQPSKTESTHSENNELVLINAYATAVTLPELTFSHRLLGLRDLSDSDLVEHLDGFVGYVMSRGDGQMTAMRYHLWRHIQRVQNHASFHVEQADVPAMSEWARRANAVLFLPDGTVRTPELETLMTAEGVFAEYEALPYLPDALARRARSLEQLAHVSPTPPASMPPVLAEAEVTLKPVAVVVHRALSLFCVATEAIAQLENAESVLPLMEHENPVGLAMLSPQEKAFIAADPADEHVAIQMSWRHEALNVLLWALSVKSGPLGAADEVVDSQAIFTLALAMAKQNSAGHLFILRPAAEILDQLDLVWRQHWAIRQAAQSDAEVEGLIPGVVMERHYVLNWLTNFQNDPDAHWDDIETPT